ncbi:NADH-quinone oxidoreductase subunit L [Actinomycetospora endophytica]|uniref:NADH-quinone oxidoreductase subunit L n=1 Tax=Actinomycetospora endophytica TaxID=2291215 RepID=A0ABS8P2Z7_9PSEU|nr:NADH-quinone oxidoreductase subunit L [Actinomycetospora endophytica]MCD2192629.1 NADH-quinone oxidoreductase subunit L [Actinomycetospora endophytica]
MHTLLAADALPPVGPASGAGSAAWILVALPALGALVLFLGGRRTDRFGHLIGVATVVLSFVYGLVLFFGALALPGEERVRDLPLYEWFGSGSLTVEFGLRLDPLSLTFVLLITGVGSLIHIYSVGYMSHDPHRRKFFAMLNLFVASMLILVLGNGFLTLYLGWEGVGLASYLLIGFYVARPLAASAAKKAFLMNRVGDVGLALAIFILFKQFGTTQYTEIFARAGEMSTGTVTAVVLLLLLGACGKSGQFPLQAWLPDAMEGPTPVSALIHAATMVTAGVYLVARTHPLYDLAPAGQLVVTIVGAITLLIGAIVGCAYDDIKKVLAYSTVSQIGYMMLAVGLGPIGYAAGLAHLLAHGFFKAGLFLGAGSVMHGMADETDMRRFGGLWRHMPITFATFTLGYLALIGFPFLSGFYTKDMIIEASLGGSPLRGWLLGGAALLAAGLTAFYMTRLMLMTFFGAERWRDLTPRRAPWDVAAESEAPPQAPAAGHEHGYHPHESSASMTVPMIILAIGSVGAGAFLVIGERLGGWLEPAIGPVREVSDAVIPTGLVPGIASVLMILGAGTAYLTVGRKPVPVERPVRVSWPVRAARADLYANAINEGLIARPGLWLSRALVYLDNRGVDGAVNGTAALLGGASGRARRTQTGFVRSYALTMLGGSLVLVAALLAVTLP